MNESTQKLHLVRSTVLHYVQYCAALHWSTHCHESRVSVNPALHFSHFTEEPKDLHSAQFAMTEQ